MFFINTEYDQKPPNHEHPLAPPANALVAIDYAIIITPAVYPRQTSPSEVTHDFIELSTRLLLWSMFPLAVGISLDLYLIGRIIIGSIGGAWLCAGVLAIYATLWLLVPRIGLIRRLLHLSK